MAAFGHDRSRKPVEDDEDPVENMIKKTGCIEKHYTVQMGRMSMYARKRIVNLRTKHKSFVSIQKEIRETDGIVVSRQSIANFWQRYQRTGKLCDAHRSGRPSKLTLEHYDFIDSEMKKNNELCAENLQVSLHDKFQIDISTLSLQRIRKKLGWRYGKTRYTQIVTEKNRLERLAFANRCLADNDQFDDVIFIDECTVKMECHLLYQWHKEGEPLHKRLRPKAKHPYQVHVWAGISAKGATDLVIFTGHLTAEFYVDILREHLIPFINSKFPNGHRYYQDNDPKHTAKLTKKFIEDNQILWMKSPPESPDINPIENLWHQMKHHIRKVNKPKTKEALVDALTEFWSTITPELCQNYINHIQKVLPVVVAREGKATGY